MARLHCSDSQMGQHYRAVRLCIALDADLYCRWYLLPCSGISAGHLTDSLKLSLHLIHQFPHMIDQQVSPVVVLAELRQHG